MKLRYTPFAKDLPTDVYEKVRRRAIRYFGQVEAGDTPTVRHRVSECTERSITFRFNRRTHNYPQLERNFQVTIKRVG